MTAPASPSASFPDAPDVETASDRYARRFGGRVGAWMLAVQTARLRELLAPWPAASVLDVGGGHAQAAVPLVALGHRVTVTGSAPACRERLDRLLGSAVEFRQCALVPLPFGDRSFDVVLALRLLAHTADWRGQVAELARVARDAVVVDLPPRRGVHRLAGRLFAWKQAIEGDARAYRTFAAGEVEAELARLGWEHVVARGELLLPLALHRLLRRAALSRALEATPAALGLTARWGAPVLLRATRSPAPVGSRG